MYYVVLCLCVCFQPTSSIVRTDQLAQNLGYSGEESICLTNWCTSYGATPAEDQPDNCIRIPPPNKTMDRESFWIIKGGWDRCLN